MGKGCGFVNVTVVCVWLHRGGYSARRTTGCALLHVARLICGAARQICVREESRIRNGARVKGEVAGGREGRGVAVGSEMLARAGH